MSREPRRGKKTRERGFLPDAAELRLPSAPRKQRSRERLSDHATTGPERPSKTRLDMNSAGHVAFPDGKRPPVVDDGRPANTGVTVVGTDGHPRVRFPGTLASFRPLLPWVPVF